MIRCNFLLEPSGLECFRTIVFGTFSFLLFHTFPHKAIFENTRITRLTKIQENLRNHRIVSGKKIFDKKQILKDFLNLAAHNFRDRNGGFHGESKFSLVWNRFLLTQN